jgi:AraC-like DNA-binding protein
MVAPGDHVEHLRPMRAETILGVGIEHEPVDRNDFTDCASVLSVGGATLIEIHAAPCRVWRTEQAIARSPADALCIYQQFDGGWFDADSAQFVVAAGSLASSSSDLPHATKPATGAGFRLRVVKIPLTLCKALIGREQDLTARALTIAPGPTALFARYFESFVAQAPHLTGAAAEAAVQTLAQLAIVARGMPEPHERRSRNAVRTGLLQSAMHMIESNIHQSDLSPLVMAGLLCISVRRLHVLFEPTGFTYARYVLSRRLERARLLLAQSPKRPVADVAYACGFDSLSTFYRSFRAAFGMSPADFRAGQSNGSKL